MKGLIAGKAHPLCELAGIADTSAMTKVSSLWQPAQTRLAWRELQTW